MVAEVYVEETLENPKRNSTVRYSFFPDDAKYAGENRTIGIYLAPPLVVPETPIEFDQRVAADRTLYANGRDLQVLDHSLPRTWGFTDRESVVGINPNHRSREEREDTWMHEVRWHVWMGKGDDYDTGFWVEKERKRGRGYT